MKMHRHLSEQRSDGQKNCCRELLLQLWVCKTARELRDGKLMIVAVYREASWSSSVKADDIKDVSDRGQARSSYK